MSVSKDYFQHEDANKTPRLTQMHKRIPIFIKGGRPLQENEYHVELPLYLESNDDYRTSVFEPHKCTRFKTHNAPFQYSRAKTASKL